MHLSPVLALHSLQKRLFWHDLHLSSVIFFFVWWFFCQVLVVTSCHCCFPSFFNYSEFHFCYLIFLPCVCKEVFVSSALAVFPVLSWFVSISVPVFPSLFFDYLFADIHFVLAISAFTLSIKAHSLFPILLFSVLLLSPCC